MNLVFKDSHMQFLIKLYFSNSDRIINLKKGDHLFYQDQFNDRLFLVYEGITRGYHNNPDGSQVELFIAGEQMFVGVNSFFSTQKTMTNVMALTDASIAYTTYKDAIETAGGSASLAEQFMPVIVNELTQRQTRTLEIGREKENTFKKLIHSEKMATVGQMAAGIAHELNNAITVLQKNSGWLCDVISDILSRGDDIVTTYFEAGLRDGRIISYSDSKKRAVELHRHFNLSESSAYKLAQTGIEIKDYETFKDSLNNFADLIYLYWEMGATLKDMLIAAGHANHVVKSVKILGNQRISPPEKININDTLNEALILLQSDLRRIKVDTQFQSESTIMARKGDLIQVWSNLIKNACESMLAGEIENPSLTVRSHENIKYIIVGIRDNGPGIPSEIIDTIFQPNVTTKIEGLSFGLGLGLTITERIINHYGGNIDVKSSPGNTEFIIYLPKGDEYD